MTRFRKLLTAAVLTAMSLGPFAALAHSDSHTHTPTQKQTTATDQAVFKNLDAYFGQLAKHNKYIGSVALYQNGQLVYHYGSTLDKAGIKATDKVLKYRAGSVTKMFTGVMALQLIEEGKLKLDSKLDTFYPGIKNAKIITIDQMLHHHSGIKSLTEDPLYDSISFSPQSPETIAGMIAGYDSVFEPGSRGEYSNSNYILLGYIIEQLTGQTYQQNLVSRINAKLGLSNTSYGGKISPANNEVYSYHWRKDQWHKSDETDMSVPHGAGAVVSTAADLNHFIQGLFAGKLLNPTSLASMTQIKDGYGKGIFDIQIYEGVQAYFHSGALDDFGAVLAYQPDSKFSLTMLSNGQDISDRDVMDALQMAIKGQLVKIPAFKSVTLTAAELKRFTGEYKSDTHPLDMTLSVEEGQLMAQATGQDSIPLNSTSATTFTFARAGIEIQFDASKSQFVITQGSRTDTFVRSNQ
ncbi:MAG: D-alanyl-D-alanine carboxypeptidase [Phenylobacterium sp.]|jgi:D-alanyl-D-alanine carboxypeptidase